MDIKICGPGCLKCKKTDETVRKAVASLGIAATVEHVSDVDKFVDYGVMMTPAIVIDGRVVLQGRIPTEGEALELLKKAAKK